MPAPRIALVRLMVVSQSELCRNCGADSSITASTPRQAAGSMLLLCHTRSLGRGAGAKSRSPVGQALCWPASACSRGCVSLQEGAARGAVSGALAAAAAAASGTC
jgi:hypothetical protein